MSKHKERIMDKYKDSAVCPGCGLPAEVCGTLENQRTKIIAFPADNRRDDRNNAEAKRRIG
jgi:hypothetical protein